MVNEKRMAIVILFFVFVICVYLRPEKKTAENGFDSIDGGERREAL